MTIKYILLLYMPTVPLYNQGATEEAGLTRAKRRVIKAMKSGVAKLTEKPDEDPTNGSADQVANLLISQFEDLAALSRQVTVFFGEGEKYTELTDPDDTVRALKLIILSAKVVTRILRLAKALTPNMRYLDLGILSDLKAVQEECSQAFFVAIRGLQALDLSKFTDAELDAIANQEDPELGSVLSEYDDEDLSTVGSISLGTKRSGTTQSKSSRSGSTKSKGSAPGSKLGGPRVGPKQGRLNTMFRYMFGAAEDLRDAGVSMSLDRPPPGGKGRPRPRMMRAPPQEEVDEDMTQAIQRGQRMAELEEEEFQALAQDDEQKASVAEQKMEDAIRRAELLADEERYNIPFTSFTVDAYKKVVKILLARYKEAVAILYAGYNNFNAYRQQRVLPARAADADVGNAVKTGSGMSGGFNMVQGSVSRMGGKVYKVGGSSDILYEREGLPRFL